MIKITKYNGQKKVFIKILEELQDNIIQKNPLKKIIRLPGYGEKHANELIEQINKQNGIIYFAEDEDIPVGMIIGTVKELKEKNLPECVPSKIVTVLQLFVKDEYREKKIGSLLINEIEKYFQEQKCDVIYVDILESNKDANNFYQKKGYRIVHEDVSLPARLLRNF